MYAKLSKYTYETIPKVMLTDHKNIKLSHINSTQLITKGIYDLKTSSVPIQIS